MAKTVLIGLILSFTCSFALPTNDELCDPKLCKIYNADGSSYDAHNIGCDNDGGYGYLCPSDANLVDISAYKDKIVHMHNKNRNKLANGDLDGYDSAARMTSLVWSDTLQYMAEFNCKTCNYSHDHCRNTPEYPQAGQNIGIIRSWPEPKPTEAALEKIFNDWWKENADADMTNMGNWTGRGGGPKIGHFAQIAQDHAAAVGCGLIVWKGDHKGKEKWFSYIVCNYGVGVFDDQRIYESGPAASNCQSGTSGDYPALCSKDEPVNFASTDMNSNW